MASRVLELPAGLAATVSAAPHRLLFLVGAGNVLAAMVWWASWLQGHTSAHALSVPANWMHALVMQYQVLPSFIFGFLLTVFPRWMDLPPADRWHYLPVGLGLLSGQALVLYSLFAGSPLALHLGSINSLAGWIAGTAILGGWLRREHGRTWHARSCFAALALGLVGWLLFVAYLHVPDPRLAGASVKLGGFGLLLPVYATVAHRMFPFFAGNAVVGYRPWRPLWLLAATWVLCLSHLALDLLELPAWSWLADLPLAALSGWTLWRWWPRAPMPALLRVLFIGYAWLPLAAALYALQSLWLATTGEFVLGRAPLHALAIGFFGGLLVAMVTRVTQGHSGRPLLLGALPALAFVGIQAVALLRVLAELADDPWPWFAIAALGWLLAFLPWALRSAWICLTPRADGKPG
jgi:uncharacterized protein involved in response to NO